MAVDKGAVTFRGTTTEKFDVLADERIVDMERYFYATTMADSLRDTAQLLLTKSRASRQTVQRMARQLNALVDVLAEALDPRWVAYGESLGLRIDEDTATVDEVVFAAATLARWIDSVLLLPGFIVGQQQARMQIQGAAVAITFPSDDPQPAGGVGTYL